MWAAEQRGGSFGQRGKAATGQLLSLRSHMRAKDSGSRKATDTGTRTSLGGANTHIPGVLESGYSFLPVDTEAWSISTEAQN